MILRQPCSDGPAERAIGTQHPWEPDSASSQWPVAPLPGWRWRALSLEGWGEETAGTQRIQTAVRSDHHLLGTEAGQTSRQRLPAAPQPCFLVGPGLARSGRLCTFQAGPWPGSSRGRAPRLLEGGCPPPPRQPLAGLRASTSPWFLQSPAGLSARTQGSRPPPFKGPGS